MTADTMAICSRAETIERSWRLLSAYCLDRTRQDCNIRAILP
jgi:hypothetical protein